MRNRWHVVIMAGGVGERLRPLTNRVPKPLLPLRGGGTLLSSAIKRALAVTSADRVWVVTTVRFHDRVTRALPATVHPRVVAEPHVRGTATCIAVMAHLIAARDAGAGMMVMPSDHWITPLAAFRQTLRTAMRRSDQQPEALTCLGIPPTSPHPAYGYMQHTHGRVTRFTEKPSPERAAAWLTRGGVLWNSGMFVGRVAAFQQAFRRCVPALAKEVARLPTEPGQALEQAMARRYQSLPVRSFDREVLERYPGVFVVRARFAWNDVGSWDRLPLLKRILAPRLAAQLPNAAPSAEVTCAC